jgi:uncharacterized protein YukE
VGEVIRVDQTALREAQPRVGAIASEILATRSRVDRALNAEGACWGADETGQRFAQSYLPAWSTLRQAFTDLHDGVESIAQSLSTVADNADAVDDRTGARFV